MKTIPTAGGEPQATQAQEEVRQPNPNVPTAASQEKPRPEPVLSRLRAQIEAMPVRQEFLGGQTTSYVQQDEVIGWIDHYAGAEPVARQPLTEALADLEAVLCDPEGNAACHGSDGDLALINKALRTLRAAVRSEA